jgi:Mg2+/Co2+ transporter CorB
MNFQNKKLFTVGVKHNNMYSVLVFLILVSKYFGISDYRMAVLQKQNLRYMQCSYVVWGHIIHKYLHNIS